MKKEVKKFNYKEISDINNRELFIELEKVIEAYVTLQLTKKEKYKFSYPIERLITVLGYTRFNKYTKSNDLSKHLTTLIEDSKASSNAVSKVIILNADKKEELPNSYFKTILFNYLKG